METVRDEICYYLLHLNSVGQNNRIADREIGCHSGRSGNQFTVQQSQYVCDYIPEIYAF
ncbi:hypothetical protein D3C87_2092720 [compost metagenome]